jgi:Ca-activated chloride channel family protein
MSYHGHVPGRARSGGRGRHRGRPGRFLPFVLAGIVVTSGLAGGFMIASGVRGGVDLAANNSTSCAGRATLSLVAAPELAPVLVAAGEAVAPARLDSCPIITVTPQSAVDTMRGQARGTTYDAWVPSSTMWLLMAAAEGGPFPTAGASIARSPVVIAAPRPVAESLGWPAHQPTWTELAAQVYSRQIPRFSMADPLRDAASLLAVNAVHAAVAGTTADPGVAQLKALTFRSRLASADGDPGALLKAAAATTDPAQATREVGLFPVLEQSLWAYGRAAPAVELVPIYPTDALAEADYPMAVRAEAASDPVRRQLAERIAGWLRGPDGGRALVDAGLRPVGEELDATGGAPSGPGFVGKLPAPIALPADAAAVRSAAFQWTQFKPLVYQVLLLIDGSASMREKAKAPDGSVVTKAELLGRAGSQAIQLFNENTTLGLWTFSSPLPTSPPYVETVPIGLIDESINGTSRRALLEAATRRKPPVTAGTPLFETILRANAAMRERYRGDRASMIVVLTDGRDEDNPFTIPKAEFLNRLAAGRDPAVRIPIHCIGYGADADMATLNEVAQATGGTAVGSSDPADLASAMARLFLAARQTAAG